MACKYGLAAWLRRRQGRKTVTMLPPPKRDRPRPPAPAPFSFHRISPTSLPSFIVQRSLARGKIAAHSLTHSLVLRYWMKRGRDRERDGSLTESNSIVERILEAMPDQRRRCDVASSLMQNSRGRLCRHRRRSSSGPSPPLRGSASSSCCC